ncbi:glycosyltransferase [Algibacter sp. L3A6]|uniref:glycosyltransferase n=1 Tax=Algibacter sp. L3A6 TaxID=2686366 RepID=UPI00131DC195|nr:glycosyltransferase [Algibacter sp. L3A6]
MKVIVSNPVKQHTNKLCIALLKDNYLLCFFTSIWYKKDNTLIKVLLKTPLKKLIDSIFKKRFDISLPPKFVKQYPMHELFRQLKTKVPFYNNTELDSLYAENKFDLFVAKKIKKQKFNVFIGYEKSCLNSFKEAKSKNAITVLDLAQVHYKYIGYLRDRYPMFKSIQEDHIYNKAASIKQSEYNLMDHVITLSTFARDTMINYGIEKKKVHVVSLGFDPKSFSPKASYNLDKTAPIKLLFAGTMTKRKGVHLLFEAMERLENVELTLIGPMADARDIIENNKTKFKYYPFMHHEELANKFREADLLVFPSYLDSWAMIVLECMACGTPVIVTENTGSKDAVLQGGGKVIPVDDVDAIITSVKAYQNNRNLLKEDGLKAYDTAQNYTWDNYYEQLNTLIENISHAG